MGRLVTRTSVVAAGGSLTDGADYNFTSNDSISAVPVAEWLGGLSGVIDGGTPGVHFTRASWTELGATTSNWQWSTTRTRNRTRTLYYDGAARGEALGPGGNCRGSYQYDTGASGLTELYVSVNVYWQVNPSYPNFQWKMWRLQQQTDGGGPEVVDGNRPSAYQTNSVDGTEMPLVTFTTTPNDVALFPGTGRFPQNGWARAELYIKENTTPGATDGLFRFRVTNASGTVLHNIVSTNRCWRGSGDNSNPFRYFIWQLYGGNASDGGGSGVTVPGNTDWGDSIWFMDDFYIAKNNGAQSPLRRVEISDGASEPVLQPFAAAGNSGTARRIVLNKGHLSTFTGCTLREYSDATTVVTTVVL